MNKHTPGPWKTVGHRIIKPGIHGFGIADCIYLEDAEANARLIGAAPELLAWTIELLKQVRLDNPNKMAGIIEHVEELIKRAGG